MSTAATNQLDAKTRLQQRIAAARGLKTDRDAAAAAEESAPMDPALGARALADMYKTGTLLTAADRDLVLTDEEIAEAAELPPGLDSSTAAPLHAPLSPQQVRAALQDLALLASGPKPEFYEISQRPPDDFAVPWAPEEEPPVPPGLAYPLKVTIFLLISALILIAMAAFYLYVSSHIHPLPPPTPVRR